MLSPGGAEVLTALFRHIEPSTASPLFFCQPLDQPLSPQIDLLLEAIDQPNLLWTDIDFACRLCVGLGSLGRVCSNPLGCASFITNLSGRRLPYSSDALVCALLDEVVDALSLMTYGNEPPAGYLRYPRPPFPLLAIDSPVNGTKVLQESDAKVFNFRSALSLCEVLLYLLQYCSDADGSDGIAAVASSHQPSINYVVKACMRAIHVCVGFEELALSPASKLERACLRVLSSLAAVGFSSDPTLATPMNRSVLERTVREILCQGGLSPRLCNTSGRVLCSLIYGWRSHEVLINNRFVGEFRSCLQRLRPELIDWLSMWDGDSQHIRWLVVGGQEVMETVWEEVLSRVEFWLYRGHPRYTLKWLGVVSTMLVECTDKRAELELLDRIISNRYLDSSFRQWIQRVLPLSPAADAEIPEMELVWALCEDLSVGNATELSHGILPAGGSNTQSPLRILTISSSSTSPTIWRIRVHLTLYLHNDRLLRLTGEGASLRNEVSVYVTKTDSHQVKVRSRERQL